MLIFPSEERELKKQKEVFFPRTGKQITMLDEAAFVPSVSLPLSNISRSERTLNVPRASVQTKPFLDLTTPQTTSPAAIAALRSVYARDNAAIQNGVCANQLGRKASDLMHESCKHISKFINACSSEEIIVYHSELSAIQTFARAFCRSLVKGDEVVVSAVEQDSTRTIWSQVADMHEIKVRFIPHDPDTGEIEFENIVELITSKTRLVVLETASRLLATFTPLEDVIEFTEGLGIPLLLNCTASWRYERMDVQSFRCAFVIAGGESIGAPGSAILFGPIDRLQQLPPPYTGDLNFTEYSFDTTSKPQNWAELPDRLASGMPSVAAAAMLGATVEKHGLLLNESSLREKAREIAEQLRVRLQRIPSVSLFGSEASARLPAACFNLKDFNIEDVSAELRKRGIDIACGSQGASVALAEHFQRSTALCVSFDVSVHTKKHVDEFVG